jgi:hypothetical protein
MSVIAFDATITLADRHLFAAGRDRLNPRRAVDAVRDAMQRIEGAGWIDVDATDFPATCPGWVTLYRWGCGGARSDTPQWHSGMTLGGGLRT